jgi:hypothetical protein
MYFTFLIFPNPPLLPPPPLGYPPSYGLPINYNLIGGSDVQKKISIFFSHILIYCFNSDEKCKKNFAIFFTKYLNFSDTLNH